MSVFYELTKRRDFFGRLLFEIVIIFIGVTAAFALEAARQEREERRYRETMIAAMIPLFDDFARHNQALYAMEPKLAAFDRAAAKGEEPMLPIFRERGSERAPVRSWDGIVTTGIPRALPPKLYMDLSLFFTRQVAERAICPLHQFRGGRNRAAAVGPATILRPGDGKVEAGLCGVDRAAERPHRFSPPVRSAGP